MSILIKGLDMPVQGKNYAICVNIWANGDVTTEFGKQVIAHAEAVDETESESALVDKSKE